MQPRELQERVQIAVFVGRTVWNTSPRDEHDVGRELDHPVDRARNDVRDVRLALIDAARSQPLVLPEAEVQVGEVDEAHAAKFSRRAR